MGNARHTPRFSKYLMRGAPVPLARLVRERRNVLAEAYDMATFTQAERPLVAQTPLGADALLLRSFSGSEAISQLYCFHLDLLAPNGTPVPFDRLLGQKMSVSLLLQDGKTKRFFTGICNRVAQGERTTLFTSYRAEVVPQFWLLTRRAQSRIFQQINVPGILQKVLEGLTVEFRLIGRYEPRDYVVQYRETDFNFACRLMEEEGMFYFFTHENGQHKMVVADANSAMQDLPAISKLIYQNVEGGNVAEDRVHDWEKIQEMRSGKYLLWDHCFELPHKHLEAEKPIQDSVAIGMVTHKLQVGNNGQLEIYDFPGEYAQRFDGVDKGGGERPDDVQKIFEDNKRTVALRMQEEAAAGVVIKGSSTCRQLVSGHRFTLDRHFNADGAYYVASVQHSARQGSGEFMSGDEGGFTYANTFSCMPLALPYRPPRVTPKPVVPGSQTAVVVGPPGEEIFTDKYGRVKVQFHWDREGKNDANSSCWVRVAQIWAGKRWGASFWPRIGQEVVVDFLEGDPDQPIILGSVYNADQMPPYQGQGFDSKHKHDNKVCGVKSNSTPGGKGFNEWRFDDTNGQEQVFVHAQRNMDTRVLNDCMELVLNDRHLIVGMEKDGTKTGDQREQVFRDKHLNVKRHHVEHVEGNVELLIGGADPGGDYDVVVKKTKKELIDVDDHLHVKNNRFQQVDKHQSLITGGIQKELVGEDSHLHVGKNRNEKIDGTLSTSIGYELREAVGSNAHHTVKGNRNEKVEGTQSLTVGGDQQEKVGGNHALEAQEIHLKAGMKIILEAGVQISLKGPGGFVDIGPAGVTIQGTMVLINSGGSAGSGSGSNPAAPENPVAAKDPDKAQDAKEAVPMVPVVADDSKSGLKSAP